MPKVLNGTNRSLVYLAQTEPRILPSTQKKRVVEDYQCLPDNTRIASIEYIYPRGEVLADVRIVLNGCTKPKSTWSDLPSDAYLYWEYEGYRKDTWKQARIQDTAVSRDIRRRGLGTMLVKKAEERMKLYGVKEISGTATEDGKKFWPTQGYKLDGNEIRKSLAGPVSSPNQERYLKMGTKTIRLPQTFRPRLEEDLGDTFRLTRVSDTKAPEMPAYVREQEIEGFICSGRTLIFARENIFFHTRNLVKRESSLLGEAHIALNGCASPKRKYRYLPCAAYLHWRLIRRGTDVVAVIEELGASYTLLRMMDLISLMAEKTEERMKMHGATIVEGVRASDTESEKFWLKLGYTVNGMHISKSLQDTPDSSFIVLERDEGSAPPPLIDDTPPVTVADYESRYSADEIKKIAEARGIRTAGLTKRDLCRLLAETQKEKVTN